MYSKTITAEEAKRLNFYLKSRKNRNNIDGLIDKLKLYESSFRSTDVRKWLVDIEFLL